MNYLINNKYNYLKTINNNILQHNIINNINHNSNKHNINNYLLNKILKINKIL